MKGASRATDSAYCHAASRRSVCVGSAARGWSNGRFTLLREGAGGDGTVGAGLVRSGGFVSGGRY